MNRIEAIKAAWAWDHELPVERVNFTHHWPTQQKAREHIEFLLSEVERLTRWVEDLHSGMFVNCVYCGHQYGPGETTPVSMADALKAHVEKCAHHPMSALRETVERLEHQSHQLRLRTCEQSDGSEGSKACRELEYDAEDYCQPCLDYHAVYEIEEDAADV